MPPEPHVRRAGADGNGVVTADDWTRDKLRARAADRGVLLRDRIGGPVDVPAWLADGALAVLDLSLDELLALVHPEDAVPAAQAFLDAVARPGEPVGVPIRANWPDRWGHWRLEWVNLLDHAEVGGVLCTLAPADGPPIESPGADDRSTYRGTNWMLIEYADDEATIVRAEGAVEAMLGYEPDELVGRMPIDFAHPDDIVATVAAWQKLRRDRTGTSERRWVRKDGSPVWLEASYLTRTGGDGRPQLIAIVWDVEERRAQQEALAHSEAENRRLADEAQAHARESRLLAEDFRLLADEVPAAVFRCETDGRVTFHNARWTELATSSRALSWVQDAVHPEDRPGLDVALRALATASGDDVVSFEARAADGDRTLAIRCRALVADGDEVRIVGSVTDITATVRLREEARLDPLTGLLNRPALEEQVTAALGSDPSGTRVAFIDLDGFKGVNDSHGHEAGDVVLAEVARRLGRAVRDDDAVGRRGGDEFVVVCGGADDLTVTQVTARIEASLRDPIAFTGGSWRPQASIGWAAGAAGDDFAAVMHRADEAMFAMKRARGAART